MRRLSRLALYSLVLVLPVLGVGLTASYSAAIPNAANSTCPATVTVSASGSACFDVTVRDAANVPVANSTVVVNLGACTPTFCPSQVHSGNTVSAISNGSGVAHFCICATISGSCTASITADGILLCSPAVAQVCASGVPQTMSYQGVLLDTGGAIVADGNYNFVFKIYDDPTLSGTHLLWTENQNTIPVARGGFNVILGMGTPAVPLALAFDKQYYLGIAVNGGAELTPRTTLASSPYSLVARSVSDCGVTSSSIASGQVVKSLNTLHDDVTLAAGSGITLNQSAQTLTINATGTGGVTGTGTANQLAKFTGTTAVGNSTIFDNGNVGIGTTSPAVRLDVAGTISGSSPGASFLGVTGNGGNVGIYAHNAVTGTEAYLAGQCCGGYFNGDVQVNGTLSKSAGSFKIDHPLDPAGKYLLHSFVESPDMMNIYNGNAQLDASGATWVQMPDWFEALNMEFRYQLTAIGAPGPNLYIDQEIKGNRFRIAGGSPGARVSWQVTGIRHDAYAEKHRIPVVEEKSAQDRGHYLHPDLFGAGLDRRVEFTTLPAELDALAKKAH
jgi:hypothetical protein